MEKLKDYINREHGGSQVDFAKAWGTTKQQVSRWMKEDVIIHDGKLYLMRKKLNT